jgi:hypothetical protein
VTGEELEAVRE